MGQTAITSAFVRFANGITSREPGAIKETTSLARSMTNGCVVIVV
jgi:hypothetical protein